MKIFCTGCKKNVDARLADGEEIYPHRPDLYNLPFWKCDRCGNFVGCHHKTEDRIKPLGCIPTQELKNARKHIHRILDPLWQKEGMSRKAIYRQLSEELGWKYHTAKLRNIEEARKVYTLVVGIRNNNQLKG